MDRLIDSSVSNPVSTTSCGQQNRIGQSYVKEIFVCCYLFMVCHGLTCWAAGVLYSTMYPCSSPFSLPGGPSHVISTSVPFSAAVTLAGGFSGTKTQNTTELKGISLLTRFHLSVAVRWSKHIAQGGLSKDLDYEWEAGSATTWPPDSQGPVGWGSARRVLLWQAEASRVWITTTAGRRGCQRMWGIQLY